MMTLGKTLRLRRIFAQGRALIMDCHPLRHDPLGWVRLLARSGSDAAILTPGLLDAAAEELGTLAVMLRLDAGVWPAQPLVSVQAALEMGVEAVTLHVRRAVRESLERFGKVSEEARRLGMPLLAEVGGEDWREAAQLSADYGADMIATSWQPELAGWQSWMRTAGKPLLVGLEFSTPAGIVERTWEVMQGPAQGVVLSPPEGPPAEVARVLEALHAIIHQDIALEEARKIAGLPGPAAF
jgi:DhnA family fructose-bisphosphate aldolase class Ia